MNKNMLDKLANMAESYEEVLERLEKELTSKQEFKVWCNKVNFKDPETLKELEKRINGL